MIERYETVVFDCDGVILNSNKVKTDAFFQAALPYGEEFAKALVDYHVANGGISRYVKFQHFLENMIPKDASGPGLEALLESYAHHVLSGLMTCEVASGLEALREASGARWLVASGGDQVELRHVFSERGLAELFNGGIFGSPDAKDTILARELSEYEHGPAALFVGDSRYDHVVSKQFGLDFVFVSQWSEFSDWRSYCQVNDIETVQQPTDLRSS